MGRTRYKRRLFWQQPLTPVTDTNEAGAQRLPMNRARMLGEFSPSAGRDGSIWHERGPTTNEPARVRITEHCGVETFLVTRRQRTRGAAGRH